MASGGAAAEPELDMEQAQPAQRSLELADDFCSGVGYPKSTLDILENHRKTIGKP